MLPAALVLCRRLRQQVAEALFPVHTPTFANMSALDTLPDRLDDMWMFGSGSDLISCPSSPISSVPSSSSCQGTTNSLTQQAKRDKPWTTPASSRTASARGTNGPAGVWAGDDKPRVRRGGPTLCYVPAKAARECPCSANGWEDEWVTSGVASSVESPQPALVRAGAIILRPKPDPAADAAAVVPAPPAAARAVAVAAADNALVTLPPAADVAAADPLLGQRAPALKRLKMPKRGKDSRAWMGQDAAVSKVQIIMCQTFEEPPMDTVALPTFNSMPLKCSVH